MTLRGIVYAAGAAAALGGSVVAWTSGGTAVAPSTAAPSAPALAGSALFRAKGCATCHDGPDTTAGGSEFPDLSDAASWAGERVPGLAARDYIAQSIRDPIAVISPQFHPGGGPTVGMPTLAVSDAEVAALVDYLLRP